MRTFAGLGIGESLALVVDATGSFFNLIVGRQDGAQRADDRRECAEFHIAELTRAHSKSSQDTQRPVPLSRPRLGICSHADLLCCLAGHEVRLVAALAGFRQRYSVTQTPNTPQTPRWTCYELTPMA